MKRTSLAGIPALMALSCLALFLAGCDGDDGAQGPQGPQGPEGPAGPEGPPGTPGSGADGTVTIGDGSGLSTEEVEEIGQLQIEITGVTVASPPVVTFTVTTADGTPAVGLASNVASFTLAKLVPADSGLPSRWVSYINRVESANTAPTPNVLQQSIQATTENGATGTFEELGDGEYQYTFLTDPENVTEPIAVEYEPDLTHRVGIELRMSSPGSEVAPANPVFDFVPAGGAPASGKMIAATENCNVCHEQLELHGGPRITVKYCVTCHNPGTIDQDTGNSVDMAHMAHSIHMGLDRAEPYIIYGNRDTEHDYHEVTYPQSVLYCENCHTASDAAADGDDWLTTATAPACGGCHSEGLQASNPDPVTGQPTYAYQHMDFGAPVANNGQCVTCHVEGGIAGATLPFHVAGPRLEKELGENFVFSILNATDVGPGLVPTIQIQVTDGDGQPINIKTDPAFASEGASLNLYVGWVSEEVYNGLPDGTSVGLRSGGRSPEARGYPYRMYIEDIQAVATLAGGGTYNVPYFTALPDNLPGDVMIVMDGHPIADGVEATPEAAVYYSGTPRATVVAQEKCENCHEFLQFHGGNRNGNPQECLVCHNADGAYADEGIGAIAFGRMLHNIHAGKIEDFAEVTYPQSLANCTACHEEGTFGAAREVARPVSTDSGADDALWTDDLASSATAAACSACHDSGPSKAHMEQNGGAFDVLKSDIAIPSSATEACFVCHGDGKIADVTEAHGL